MKLRLLKPLPGAEIGTISKPCSLNEDAHVIGNCSYDPLYLIAEGWAEEVKEERWYPKDGEKTYILNGSYVEVFIPNGCGQANALRERVDTGLCTKTREELETTLLLLKLRQSNVGFVPKNNETYYVVNTDTGSSDDMINNSYIDGIFAIVGNCYRTREEADKYAPEWKKLFDSVK